MGTTGASRFLRVLAGCFAISIMIAGAPGCRPAPRAAPGPQPPTPSAPPTVSTRPEIQTPGTPIPTIAISGTADIPPAVRAPSEIIVGTEYVLVENPARVKRLAEMLAPIGLSAAKPYSEHIEWGEMQKAVNAPIDLARLDRFVGEFQKSGFTELILALKSHNAWASRDYGKLITRNPAPKPEFVKAYENWIRTIVERYDADGVDDMPGLAYPVRMFEIGSEFSSYEPEPVNDYLEMLAVAYTAAHQANPDVLITHAAFLTTTVFKNNPSPDQYPAAFAAAPARFMQHSLADIRKVLDHPDVFDLVNFHSIGDPYEIEANVKWLAFEMQTRGYSKPVLLSDTSTTPFVAWGFALECNKSPEWMGLVIPPATEADRCRLADYFRKLVKGDPETVAWTQSFAAQDTVKKVVIAAEQGIFLVNTSFTEDLFWQKLEAFQAGAGTAAWAGLIDFDRGERRAGFYSLQQLMEQLRGYSSIRRLPYPESGIRVYEIKRGDKTSWIAWYDSGSLLLPGDSVPEVTISLTTRSSQIVTQALKTDKTPATGEKQVREAINGAVPVTLSAAPLFIEEVP